MPESHLLAARRDAEVALARLRAAERAASGQDMVDGLRHSQRMAREVFRHQLEQIHRCDTEGVFTDRGMYAGPAVTDILNCHPGEARRLVKLAARLFPTTLDGRPVEPTLPATAAAFAKLTIDRAHLEVIDHLLSSATATRLEPDVWAGAEATLADWATTYGPKDLQVQGRQLIDTLDQDGAEPDDDADDQVNELHLTASRDGHGGRIKGRLDSSTFDALGRVLNALATSEADERKSLAQRQADALGELCEHTLDQGTLPDQGGEKPHLSVILGYDKLVRGIKGVTVAGLRIGPREIRRIACDPGVLPIVLGGRSEPLDVGREQRVASKHLRRALAARDGGCAHPGCDRPSSYCSVHHIRHWADGGTTETGNLVMLCRTHHKMVHTSGWSVRIRDSLPEFIPPKWLDYEQKPRRKHPPNSADLSRHESVSTIGPQSR